MIKDKVEQIRKGKLTAEENVKGFLEKINKENKKINAVLSLNENALSDAQEIDKKKNKGKLAGICFIVKSNICVKGLEVNCASKTLEGWKAPYDATVISKIKKEDGIILGMANMDEFACGGSGETSAFGVCENPSAIGKIPGGSSSGSAASVAAGFCDVALGSDTGGSIRNPASHCGVVGVKSSYGLVSRYGLIDMCMSLDTIGVFSKNVEDTGFVLDIIKGKDEKDPTTFFSNEIKIKEEKNVIIGVMESVSSLEIQKLIDSKILESAEKYKWKIKKINLSHIDLAVQTYYPIVYTEFFSGTRKFDGRRFGKLIEESCGPEVLRRILGGSEISRAEYEGRYYKKALEVKEFIRKEFEKAFKDVDCIITPTVPRLPHKIGSQISPKEMYSYDSLTTPANLAGICAISIPAGKIFDDKTSPSTFSPTTRPKLAEIGRNKNLNDKTGVPVGMQIMCKQFDESKMFSIAKMIEGL